MNTSIPTSTKPLNVMVADQSRVYVDALKHIINECKDTNLVACSSTASNLLSVLTTSDIDVLVIDPVIFGDDAATGIKEIKEQFPDLRIIVLSLYESTHLKNGILEVGVESFISKWGDTSKLLNLITNR